MKAWWERYKVDVPEGQSGDIKVEHFTVDEQAAAFHMLRCLCNGHGYRGVQPGTYTRLVSKSDFWMSDTPAEIRDHTAMFRIVEHQPSCTVLLHGLGLGMALNGCLLDGARHVTVVEVNPDVIALVWPHWQKRWKKRVTLIEADALTWKPPKGSRWDVVWHDIWSEASADNLETMKLLHRRFGRRATWQESWCRAECKRLAREEARDVAFWAQNVLGRTA